MLSNHLILSLAYNHVILSSDLDESGKPNMQDTKEPIIGEFCEFSDIIKQNTF